MLPDVNPKRRAVASLLILSALATSCATAPSVCPRLPDPPAPVELGPSFLDQMRTFLSGSLPEPTNYELRSAPARPGLRP